MPLNLQQQYFNSETSSIPSYINHSRRLIPDGTP